MQDLCEPQGYREMHDENHKAELRHCKLRSKSWNGDTCRPRRNLRHRKSVFTDCTNDGNSAPRRAPYSRTISTPAQVGGNYPWLFISYTYSLWFCRVSLLKLRLLTPVFALSAPQMFIIFNIQHDWKVTLIFVCLCHNIYWDYNTDWPFFSEMLL